MTLEEKAEAFEKNLKGLGYEKRNVGKWVRSTKDTGEGFPEITYICPFCKATSTAAKNYCADCGARLNDEND